MHRKTEKWSALCAVAVTLALIAAWGCGPSKEELAAQARTEEWTAIQEDKAALDEKREELAVLEQELEAVVGMDETELEEGETVESVQAELQQRYANLDAEIERLAGELSERVVAYINDDPWVEGTEPSESQLAALRLKASEDLLLADEWGEKGGDWARAIGIAEQLEENDPENPEVQERLEHYRSMRYMTEDRFSQAEVGMSPDEVKDAIGVPSRGNDRPFGEDRRGFFYLKGEDRSAAAVYFQKEGEDWVAYKVDFDAIEGQGGDS